MAKFFVVVDDGGNIVAIARNPEEQTFVQRLIGAAGGIGELAALLNTSAGGVSRNQFNHSFHETVSGLTLGDRVRASERLTDFQREEIFHLLDTRVPLLDTWEVVPESESRIGDLPIFLRHSGEGALRLLPLIYYVDP